MTLSGVTPRWASPPGETVAAIVRERDLKASSVASELGLTTTTFDSLLSGDLAISLALATSLSAAVGASAAFWLTREAQYREDLDRVEADRWSLALPLKQMSEFGWIREPTSWQDRISIALSYFGVADVADWDRRYAASVESALFRTSETFAHELQATAVWFRACELEANRIEIASRFDPVGFRSALQSLRSLTRQPDPSTFMPILIRECAKVGVRVVVVRAPKGCTASGSTRVYRGAPLISLSSRHMSDDHFWFTFFHEAAHLLDPGAQPTTVDRDEEVESDTERAANGLAHTMLFGDVASLPRPGSYKDVIRFAQQVGVSPGVVVGQLQHLGLIRRNQYNSLKRFYRWSGTTLERAGRP